MHNEVLFQNNNSKSVLKALKARFLVEFVNSKCSRLHMHYVAEHGIRVCVCFFPATFSLRVPHDVTKGTKHTAMLNRE